ncbi:hypothetical protein LPJ68_005152 [Coemansia sp. RSA 1086]|nr:hypothetical protein LPJ68_005152 [Coemansia sp. RSA 1086]
MPSKLVTSELIDSSGKPVGYLTYGYNPFISRTIGSNYFTTPLYGSVFTDKELKNSVNVTAGQYHIRLSALKLFGNIERPSDFEVWNSETFTVDFTNAFNANNNFAHFNDDTLYVNDKDATVANNNLNTFNNANIVA